MVGEANRCQNVRVVRWRGAGEGEEGERKKKKRREAREKEGRCVGVSPLFSLVWTHKSSQPEYRH